MRMRLADPELDTARHRRSFALEPLRSHKEHKRSFERRRGAYTNVKDDDSKYVNHDESHPNGHYRVCAMLTSLLITLEL